MTVYCTECPWGCPEPGRTPKCSDCVRVGPDPDALDYLAAVVCENADYEIADPRGGHNIDDWTRG